MKKSILFTSFYFVANFLFGQHTLVATIEAITSDKTNVRGFATATTLTMAYDVKVNYDEINSYALSLGPILSKRHDDAVKIAVMPGFMFTGKQFFFSGMFLFKTEEIDGVEAYVYAKGMRSISGEATAKFLFDGEFLRRISRSLQVGLGVRAEEKKRETFLSREEIMVYDDMLSIEGRWVLKPKGWKRFSLTGVIGFEHYSSAGKTVVAVYSFENRNNLSTSFGLGFNL